MLLSFRVANHRSIRDELQLVLTPVYQADRPAGTDWPAVPVAGVFGANAAGKSNVLDALCYMRSMVMNSLRDAEPDGGVGRRPFGFDPELTIEPSTYALDLMLGSDRYTYGFAVDDSRVLAEWLYRYRRTSRYPEGRRHVLFERDGDSFTFSSALRSALGSVSEITGPNILLLSVAARLKQDELISVYTSLSGGMRFLLSRRHGFSGLSIRSMRMLERSTDRQRVLDFIKAADLGVSGIEVIEVDDEGVDAELLLAVHELSRAMADRRPGPEGEAELSRLKMSVARAQDRRHRVRLPDADRLLFTHHTSKGENRLAFRDQSQGTVTLLNLAGDAFGVLDRGGLLVIDEIDASLHPLLSAQLIGLFQCAQTNPQRAQLLFTSHDATLLGRLNGEEVLKRDQIWFAEKDSEGATRIFPLSDFKPRQEESRERRYLNGSYGAVPFVAAEPFRTALTTRRTESSGAER